MLNLVRRAVRPKFIFNGIIKEEMNIDYPGQTGGQTGLFYNP